MSQYNNPYSTASMNRSVAANAAIDERAGFIRKTYAHLLGAILALVGLDALIFAFVDVQWLTGLMMGGRWSWLVVLGLFMGVSWLATSWAQSDTSRPIQYAGLGLYVVAEAIILAPMLAIALIVGGPGTILTAALATLAIFAALTAIVWFTAADLSFLRGGLMLAGIAAMGVIIAAIAFGFELGPIFSVLMIALASGYILYHTSNVVHHYRIDQHVAASLALFASVALMFWYVLRIVMSMNRN